MNRDLTVIGRALAAPARSAMLNLLMDGSARPVSELADAAGVGAPAASEHLAVLVGAGMLTCGVAGRQRLYRIARPSIAAALEHIGELCPDLPVRSLRQSREQRDLALARLCYDHLAGRVAVQLTDAYLARGWLEAPALAVTAGGERRFGEFGIDVAALRHRRRPMTRSCADWTERRPHLAGSLGAAVATEFLNRRWVSRRVGGGRGLIITRDGADALSDRWDIRVGAPTTAYPEGA